MRAPSLLGGSSNKAAALIIVLAFVVLLTGLALAYFTRTTMDRQLAQSSYNDTSADLLVRSALDIVVSDFQQEIVNGSSPTPIPGPQQCCSGTTTIYVPSNAAYMIPVYSPSPAPSPAILNLIRESVRGDTTSGTNPVPFPAVGSRASAINSTADASANGRSISTARWNSHYLIPLGGPSPSPGSSPVASFSPPDWVIVTRAGPTPFASWNATLADPSLTNTNYAIGRYAYAVYDEGGLLDSNVAGYPTPAPTPIIEYIQDIGRKGVLAWADLTAIVPTPTPSGTPFTKTFIGFRNYATTQENNTSDFGFSFTNTGIDNFINYVIGGHSWPTLSPHVGISTDYGTVNPVTTGSGSAIRTDQSFITRVELINFFKSASINVNMLQYLGTFSREQNKPTLPLTPSWPSAWPKVVLPRRFYLGNLYCVQNPVPANCDVLHNCGLQFAAAGPTVSPNPGPCDSQLRWEYVGTGTTPCPATPTPTPTPTATPTASPTATAIGTPLSYIPALPCDLTKLDFFQYINYALFGVITDDFTHIPFTLGIGAALIDQYDAENPALLTGLYYTTPSPTPTPTPTATPTATPSPTPTPCDFPAIDAYIVYGAEQTGSTIRYVNPTSPSPAPPTPAPLPASPFGPPNINSPTRNVGEFGWAYSILNAYNNRNGSPTPSPAPQYLIDFKDPYDPNNNPDPALLDFFTYNSAPVRSGIVSLNTRQAPVLAAILKGAFYGGQSFVLSRSQALNAADAIVSETSNLTSPHGPAMSRADIARLGSVVNTAVAPFNNPNGTQNTQDTKDTIARALSEVTQTRTWGLLIDLVAQTGHYKPNATNLQTDFIVEGEKHYWLHVAIDRFDGSIVGQQLEEVTE